MIEVTFLSTIQVEALSPEEEKKLVEMFTDEQLKTYLQDLLQRHMMADKVVVEDLEVTQTQQAGEVE